ncbi:MAG: hypothetical protein WC956_06075 [bacterium]
MKKITSMPKATLAELILFIAENESFSSVKDHLKGGFTVSEVRAALRELAAEVTREALADGDAQDATAVSELSSKTREIISALPQDDGQRLLAAFGLTSE